MNQKDAVYKAITSVKGEDSFDGAVVLSKEEREKVTKLVTDYFENGDVTFSDGQRQGKELATYVSGLISNWIRKDERLNGDVKYVTKNPGSRVGAGDSQLKAMRELLATIDDPEVQKKVQDAINKRVDELKPKTMIDIDALPEHLREYVK